MRVRVRVMVRVRMRVRVRAGAGARVRAPPRKLLCPQRLSQLGQMPRAPLAQRRACVTAA